MHEVTMAPPLVWSRSFPAAAAQIRETRRFLAGILGDLPEAINFSFSTLPRGILSPREHQLG